MSGEAEAPALGASPASAAEFSYEEAILRAIAELKSPTGSSQDEIKKHVAANMPVGNAFCSSSFGDSFDELHWTKRDICSSKSGYMYKLSIEKECGGCGLMKRKNTNDGLSSDQWNKVRPEDRRCLACLNGKSCIKICYGVHCYETFQPDYRYPAEIVTPAVPREEFRVAQWGREKPLCKSCEETDWQSRALGVGCPLVSWAKIFTGELPSETLCTVCRGERGYDECDECRGYGDVLSDDIVQDEVAVVLRERKATRDELLLNGGDWDVIMTAGSTLVRIDEGMREEQYKFLAAKFEFQCQKVKGSLKFTNGNGGLLNGSVTMQHDFKFSFLSRDKETEERVLRRSRKLSLQEASAADIESYAQFVDSKHDNRHIENIRIASNAFAIKANYGGEDIPDGDGHNSVTGIIQVVESRIALPRMKHRVERRPSDINPARFFSAEEGEIQMERYRRVGGYWICSKLGMETDVAKLVRQYLCPEPVFFLEPGDIFIRNMVLMSAIEMNKYQPTFLVARRKKMVKKV